MRFLCSKFKRALGRGGRGTGLSASASLGPVIGVVGEEGGAELEGRQAKQLGRKVDNGEC